MVLSPDYLMVFAGWLVALKWASGLGRGPVAGVCLCWVFAQYVNNCGFLPLVWRDYDPEAAWRSALFLGYGVTREGTLSGQWSTLLSVAIVIVGTSVSLRGSREIGNFAPLRKILPTDNWQGMRRRILVAVASTLLYSSIPLNLPMKEAAILVTRSLMVAGAIVEQQRLNGILNRSWRDHTLLLIAVVFAFQSTFVGGFASGAFLLLGPVVILRVANARRHQGAGLHSIGRTALVMLMIPLAAGMWMTVRDAVRSVAWSQQEATLLDGLAAAAPVDHIGIIDVDSSMYESVLIRFNHAHWVARVEANHRIHPELRGVDSKVPYVALSWLPRYFWSGKPPRTGGSKFLGLHSGHVFGQSTTWGYGIIIDGFVYAGWAGVIILLCALGWLLGLIDRAIVRASMRQDWQVQWIGWASVAVWFDPLVDAFDGCSGSVISALVGLLAARIRR